MHLAEGKFWMLHGDRNRETRKHYLCLWKNHRDIRSICIRILQARKISISQKLKPHRWLVQLEVANSAPNIWVFLLRIKVMYFSNFPGTTRQSRPTNSCHWLFVQGDCLKWRSVPDSANAALAQQACQQLTFPASSEGECKNPRDICERGGITLYQSAIEHWHEFV